MNNLGIFDITVNGVLVHSRKCDTRAYGVPGHLWLRDNPARQHAVWHAINSVGRVHGAQRGPPSVLIRSSTYGAKHATRVAEMLGGWFPNDQIQFQIMIDDSSEWNFEILLNGVLLHSRNTQWHGFLEGDWSQQGLLWRSLSDLLIIPRNNTVKEP